MKSSATTRRHRRVAAGFVLLSTALLGAAALVSSSPRVARPVYASAVVPATYSLDHPDAVCAQCHQAIYASYEKSAMARGSGLATQGLLPGEFRHQPSGIKYAVFLREGAAWMSFARPSGQPPGALDGERRLEYFIGSGHRGRTYLYQQSGQWFELPINFYTRRASWDMAPAYDNAPTMPAALPVDPNCLHCHATDIQQPQPTARNRFEHGPFQQGGIGCRACHGDPAEHLAKNGHGPIVNPGKLDPVRRDSACIQCHLEGEAVVYKPGRSLTQFKAGDDLSQTAVYFVRASHQDAGRQGPGQRATSQYEALLRSACKRASGDKLTCTTCHDPHSDPSPAGRVQYFRARCLACHTGADMATHHAEQPDCAKCHMPSRSTSDISHEQVTDHDIEPQAVGAISNRFASAASASELVPVGGVHAGDREYGLAYAQMAQRGDAKSAAIALDLLRTAAASGANDEEFEVRLGYLEQRAHNDDKARAAYTAALAQDPYEPSALANLAVLDAASGRVQEAIRLLDRLVSSDPSQTAAGLNLAYIDCKLGRTQAALDVVHQLQRINPDDDALRRFADDGTFAGQSCSLHGTK